MNKINFLNLVKNYVSTMLFISILFIFYTTSDYYSSFLIKDFSLFGEIYNTKDIYLKLVLFYAIFLIPYYIFEREKSKARLILNYIGKRFKNKNYQISQDEKLSLLSWIVKGFYAPLLVCWFVTNISVFTFKLDFAVKNFYFFRENFYVYFNSYIFIIIFYFLLLIDTLFFTLGYLLESKYLKNKIKSVDSTLSGWIVTLICYPPFNLAIGKLLGWYSVQFPKFGENFYHYIFTVLLLVFFAIYSRSSLSLGLKASNLTNRGIVKKGPYRFVRHPAYISKNISRFIGALPAYILAFSNNDFKMIFVISLSLFGRISIYILRAITEEKHLSKDEDYQKYKKLVKYKFIPGVW